MTVEWHSEKKKIKTYKVIDEDPLPRFFQYYPYTGLNNFDDKAELITYDAIVVENEYLKMLVIPALGARLHDLFDKVNKTHVFHYNETIRPANIALRGAWIANGIEFNCLDRGHHTPDNFSPVDYKVKEWEDGSVTFYLGNINLITNIYYLVGLTLRPGRQFLEVSVKTFNNDVLRTKYYFWTNTAESVTEGSRVFIPGKHTVEDTFPINKEGIDVSWYRNNKYAVDAFVIDSEEDFFGYYDYNMHYGVVQHANHFKVPGKKRFTWGTSEDGLFWAPILSDKGIPYIELQSGKFRTQAIVGFVDPHFFDEWKEWWYPISKVRGISYANKDATVYVDVNPEGKTVVGIYVTKDLPNSKVVIHAGENVIEEKFDLSPGNPFVKEFTFRNKGIKVDVIDECGIEIISWDCRDYRTKIDESVYLRPSKFSVDVQKTAEEFHIDGKLEERMGSSLLAELKYKQALKVDQNFSEALCSLASIYYRRGAYREAVELLKKALKRNLGYDEAHYYLGLCYLKLGKDFEAEMEFWEARKSTKYFVPSSYSIAVLKIRNKEYKKAEEILEEAIERNSVDLKCSFLLAANLRKQGKVEEALKVINKTLEIFPLYYPLLSEMMLCTGKLDDSEFKRIVLAGEQKLLEVAKEYLEAGLYDDAIKILEIGVSEGVNGPMVHYYLGFAYEKIQRNDKRDDHYKVGNSKDPNYVFPHRLEEEEMLRSVIANSENPKPRYYLGNLLFHLGRFKEAVDEWEAAEKEGLNYSILHRNLGFAYHKVYRNHKKALEEYEKAIATEPMNYRLYPEYYEICSWMGLVKKAVKTLEEVKDRVRKDIILATLSSAYIDVGRYNEALKILEENTFTPAEGYYGYWELFVEAHMRKGIECLKTKKYEDALNEFLKALTYPKNLGVGAPYAPHRHEAKQKYWLGQCYSLIGKKEKAREVWESIFTQKFFTTEEIYYKGLALKMLGRRKEASRIFKDKLEEASRREKEITSIKKEIPKEYFNVLNYDKELIEIYCTKLISYLGLDNKKKAKIELKKALRIKKTAVFIEKPFESCPFYVSIKN